MKSSSRLRTPCRLSDSVHRQLNMYALAASAAGVGVLALAQPADAKIVYTKTHRVIGPNSSYPLDLNHDGKSDFTFSNNLITATSGTARSLRLYAAGANQVEGAWGPGSRSFLAAALKYGTRIPKGRFSHATARMAFQCDGFSVGCSRTSSEKGNWFNVTNRYLGLKFRVHGKTHYAWARLNVQFTDFTLTGTLTGYAYETVPDKAIIAGKTKGPDVSIAQPATLGRLALGKK